MSSAGLVAPGVLRRLPSSHRDSVLPSRRSRTSSTDDAAALERRGRLLLVGSIIWLTWSAFALLGGLDALVVLLWGDGNLTTDDADHHQHHHPLYLDSMVLGVAYFAPLLVPLGLYAVIARWTGEQYVRHS